MESIEPIKMNLPTTNEQIDSSSNIQNEDVKTNTLESNEVLSTFQNTEKYQYLPGNSATHIIEVFDLSSYVDIK